MEQETKSESEEFKGKTVWAWWCMLAESSHLGCRGRGRRMEFKPSLSSTARPCL
jgi:hypothetical protein